MMVGKGLKYSDRDQFYDPSICMKWLRKGPECQVTDLRDENRIPQLECEDCMATTGSKHSVPVFYNVRVDPVVSFQLQNIWSSTSRHSHASKTWCLDMGITSHCEVESDASVAESQYLRCTGITAQ